MTCDVLLFIQLHNKTYKATFAKDGIVSLSKMKSIVIKTFFVTSSLRLAVKILSVLDTLSITLLGSHIT